MSPLLRPLSYRPRSAVLADGPGRMWLGATTHEPAISATAPASASPAPTPRCVKPASHPNATVDKAATTSAVSRDRTRRATSRAAPSGRHPTRGAGGGNEIPEHREPRR